MTPDNFHSQNRGGKGIKGMNVIDEDHIEDLFMTSTHNYIMFFTNKGRVYRLKGYEIPESGRTARGVNIINLLQLQPEEKITAIIPIIRRRKTALSRYGYKKRSCKEDSDLMSIRMSERTVWQQFPCEKAMN